MRAIGVIGPKNSGKTTLITDIVKKLKDMDYSVAVIKHSGEGISFDKKDSDTDKFRKYADEVVFSSDYETVFFSKNTDDDLYNIMSKLDYDFVIIEGFKEKLKELNIPKILMVVEDIGLEYGDSHTVRVIKDYNYNIEEIIRDVLEKSIIPSYNLNCGHCGFNCKLFVEEVISDNVKWNDCVLTTGLKLKVNGKLLPVNPFVSKIIINTLKGMISTLKGGENPKSIEIVIENLMKKKNISY